MEMWKDYDNDNNDNDGDGQWNIFYQKSLLEPSAQVGLNISFLF